MKLINNSSQTITSGTDRFRQVLSFNSTAKKKISASFACVLLFVV